jgi:hypothetical protein
MVPWKKNPNGNGDDGVQYPLFSTVKAYFPKVTARYVIISTNVFWL